MSPQAMTTLPTGPGGGDSENDNEDANGGEGGDGEQAAPDIEPGEWWSALKTRALRIADWYEANEPEALAALGAALGLWVGLILLRWILKRLIGGFGQSDPYALPAIVARAVGKISAMFLLVLALGVAALVLPTPEAVRGPVRALLVILGVLQAASLVQEIAVSLLKRRAMRAAEAGSTLSSAVAVLKWLMTGVIWAIALLVVFDTFGVQVTAIIAGLGVGGIAIGLAAQGIFSDLFASLSILFDKPFRKGDFIIVGEVMGTVEEIGLRTTRIRSLHGQQVVMSNADLLSETIHNYQIMTERRHVDRIDVIYQTPADTVAAIPGWLKAAVESVDDVRFDRAHFTGFGESALAFELVYFVTTPDYYAYMDVRQAVALAIMRRFEQEGVEFAYPTRTLFLAEPNGRAIDPRVDPEPGGGRGAGRRGGGRAGGAKDRAEDRGEDGAEDRAEPDPRGEDEG